MSRVELPRDLQSFISAEKVDFIAYARRKKPLSHSYKIIILGLVWLSVTAIVTYAMVQPILNGKGLEYRLNDKSVVASFDNLSTLIIPVSIITLFSLAGIAVLTGGIVSMFKKGGYYVGTESRIIHYLKSDIDYYSWDQFTGNIELDFNENCISLEMNRGEIKREKNGLERFVHEELHLSGVENVAEIERICRKRINENNSISS